MFDILLIYLVKGRFQKMRICFPRGVAEFGDAPEAETGECVKVRVRRKDGIVSRKEILYRLKRPAARWSKL